MTRQRLPNRRGSETFEIKAQGLTFTVTFSRSADGKIQEVFLTNHRAGSDAGIDVVSSEYATVAAEQTAVERLADVVADQIVARLGIYAARTVPKP